MIKYCLALLILVSLVLILVSSVYATGIEIVEIGEVLSFKDALSRVTSSYKEFGYTPSYQKYMFGGKAGIPFLSNAIDTETDPYARAASCAALGVISIKESFDVLQNFFYDSDPLVRMQSVISASYINNLLTQQDLRQLFINPNPYTKWVIPPVQRKNILLISLKSSFQNVKRSAEHIASRMGAPEFIVYAKSTAQEQPFFDMMFKSEVKSICLEDTYEKLKSTNARGYDKYAWKLAQLGAGGFNIIKETLSNSSDTQTIIKAIVALGYCFDNKQARKIIRGYLNNDDLRIAQTAANTLRINLEEADRVFLLAAKQNNPLLNIDSLIERHDLLGMKYPSGKNLELDQKTFKKYYSNAYSWFKSKQDITRFINIYNKEQIVSCIKDELNSDSKVKYYDLLFSILALINSESSKRFIQEYANNPKPDYFVWIYLASIGDKYAYNKLMESAKFFKLRDSYYIKFSDMFCKFDKKEVLPTLRYLIKYPSNQIRREMLASLALLGNEDDIRIVLEWADMEEGQNRMFIASALQKRDSKLVVDYFARSLKLEDHYVISGAIDYYIKNYKPSQRDVLFYTLKMEPDALTEKFIKSGIPELTKLGKESYYRYGKMWN
jgi:hypothetical protein